jgi:hypothetical protein
MDAYGLADRKAILPELQRCTPDEPEQLGWLQGIAGDHAGAPMTETAGWPGCGPRDGNARGIFTVPSMYDLPYLGHTLRQDDKQGPLHGARSRCSADSGEAGYPL